MSSRWEKSGKGVAYGMSQQRRICEGDANGNGIIRAVNGPGEGGKLREGGAKVQAKKA